MGSKWMYYLEGYYGLPLAQEGSEEQTTYHNGGHSNASEEEPGAQADSDEDLLSTDDDIKKWGIILRRLADSFEEEYDRRRMQNMGRNFRKFVETMRIPPEVGLSAVRQAILKNGDLSEDEMKAVRLIDACINENRETTSTIISEIAGYLRKCMTASTFRMALASLCYSPSSVPEEVAAACDLVAVIYPRLQEFVSADSIYAEFTGFIERCLGEVHH